MSVATESTSPNPLLSLRYEDCAECLADPKLAPKDTGRPCQHQHNRLDVGVTTPLWLGVHDLRLALGFETLADTVRYVLVERISKLPPLGPVAGGATSFGAAPAIAGSSPAGPPAPLPAETSGMSPEAPLNVDRERGPSRFFTGLNAALLKTVGPENFQVHFAHVRWSQTAEAGVTCYTANHVCKERLDDIYLEVIADTLERLTGYPWTVSIEVAAREAEIPEVSPKVIAEVQALIQEIETPRTKEELDAKQLAEEEAELTRWRCEAIEATAQLQHATFGERNTAQKAINEEHEINKRKLAAKHAKESAAFVAMASPALIYRQPGNPKRQYQDHTRVPGRKGASGFEPNTEGSDGPCLPVKVTTPTKPDTS